VKRRSEMAYGFIVVKWAYSGSRGVLFCRIWAMMNPCIAASFRDIKRSKVRHCKARQVLIESTYHIDGALVEKAQDWSDQVLSVIEIRVPGKLKVHAFQREVYWKQISQRETTN
jgi:hypothetical protein